MNYPDNNPKTIMGVQKVPLHLVPPSSTHYLALAFKDGATKYGPYNWRDKTVSSSIYVGAAKRHIDAWLDGENLSADAKVHHLAHAMACLAIILDAESVGKLNDDRPTKGAASRLQADFNTPVEVAPVQLKLPFKELAFEQETTRQTIGSPVPEGYSGFLVPPSDPVEQRWVPYVQKNVRPQSTIYWSVNEQRYVTRSN